MSGFAKSFWLLLKRHKAVGTLLLLLLVTALVSLYKIKQNENRAVLNEEKAQINETKAIINEKKSKDTLAKYIKEKEFTGKISEKFLIQLQVVIENNLTDSNFEGAQKFINEAIEFHPDNELVNALNGMVNFYSQNYQASLFALQKSGKFIEQAPFKEMHELAPKYIELTKDKEFIDAENLAKLTMSFKEPYRKMLFNYQANKFSSGKKYKLMYKNPGNHKFMNNHLEYCCILISKINTNELKYKYELMDSGIKLDINGSQIEHLKYLKHLPMISLNLENTTFWRRWVLSHYYLKSLNIRNCHIKRIYKLDIPINTPLRELILTPEQFKNSQLSKQIKGRVNFVQK